MVKWYLPQTLCRLEPILGPNQITRYNLFPSSLITGDAIKGVSSGDVLKIVEEITAKHLPRGYSVEWSGVSKEERESGGKTIIIFVICLFFVYLLLAAQYESLLPPFPIILPLPAFLFLKMVGLENNIYVQVALVMLIGLLGKNAILIIEMVNQYRKEGMSILQSAIKASISRLRPILMTSFGLIPLTSATGASAIGNRSIGTAAGGMFIGTIVGLFLIPGLHMIFEGLASRKKNKQLKTENNNEETV